MDPEEFWTPALVGYLRNVTRELKFDWNAISEQVRVFADQENLTGVSVTPADCRKWFASDYHVTVTTATSPVAVLSAGDQEVEVELKSPAVADYESMSMDELVAHVEATELHMKQRKEEIFGRVLSSLGGGAASIESTVAFNSATSVTTTTTYSDYELTRQAYAENLAKKESERLKKIAFAEEQAEKLRLEKEREILKRRFDVDSADGVGENPLAHLSGDPAAGFKYGDSSGLQRAGEKVSAELEFIDSMPYDPNVSQALENFMETDEFEVMLSELEREIDAMAPSKGENEPPSELSEILKVLETAAAVNTARAETKRSAPIVLPPSPPKKENSSQRAGAYVAASSRRGVAVVDDASLDASASGKEGYVTKPSADSYVPRGNVPAQSAVPVTGASPASGSATSERVAHKEIQYERSRRGAPAPTDPPARAESPVSDASSASNSDSEDDWRSQRNKQKKTAGLVSTRSHQANQDHGPAKDASLAPPNAFWGAFGGAPTVRNTVRSTAQATVTSEYAEEVEDVRFNSAIAEYAQSVGLKLHRSEASDSDDESFEDKPEELEREEMAAPVELEEEPELESEEEEATSLNYADSLPIPPAKTVQETPVEPFLPPAPQEFVPLSSVAAPVPVQAASGLLGAAGASRRAKGKVGSIMSASRPRKEPPTDEPSVHAAASVPDAVEAEDAPVHEYTSTAVTFAVTDSHPFTPAATAAAHDVEELEPVPEEVVVSAAEVAAAAVQRAVALDQIFAPVLSPLPYAYISNKASGSVAEFSVDSLPAKLSNAGGSVERIVLVDIKLDALRAVARRSAGAGDSVWVCVAAWLMEAAAPNFAVLGMQCGTVTSSSPLSTNSVSDPATAPASVEAEEVCRLVLETSSDRVTDADLLYLAKTTLLSSVFTAANLTVPATTIDSAEPASVVADFLHIRDSMTAPLMGDLEFFSLPLSNDVLVPHLHRALASGETDPSILTRAKDIAVCAIKSHVLSGANLLPSASGSVSSSTVLTQLVAQAERAGLRLCGMRLVHLKALELFEFEHHCSVPGYTRPVPPASPAGNHAYNPHVLPVLCLAFHSSSHAATSDHAPQVTSASTKNAVNTCPQSAANVLRNLLGPEDPSLARKTDPLSLRAVYGTSKEHNLAYALPHSVDRLYKETAFWFGGRPTPTDVSKNVALLRVAAPRQVQIVVTLDTPREALDASSACQLSALQTAAMRSVSERFDVVGKLTAFCCVNTASISRAALKSTSEPATNAENVEGTPEDVATAVSSLQLRWTFESHVGDAFLAHSAAAVQNKVTAASAAFSNPWHVEATWSSAAGHLEESHVAGSRLVALEMMKKVSEDDLKSHEDVGLPDIVVVTIGGASAAERSTNESPVAVLSSVLSMLPCTCEATLVAVKSVHHGAGLSCVLRGYQILENIDYAVAEVQRMANGGASPGKNATAKLSLTGDVSKVSSNTKGAASSGRPAVPSLCDTVKIHRGKRALEMIFTEFPLSSLYCDLAVRDLHTYVPLPSLQRTGLSWHAQATAVSAAAAYSSSQLTTESSAGDTLLNSPAQYLQALYPPGVFTAVGVLVVPWLHDSAIMTRNVARIVARLEKDNFAVLEMKAVASLSAELVTQLYQENCAEYSSSAKGASGRGTSISDLDESLLNDLVQRVAHRNAVVILVRRRSALLQLKSTIGPVYNSEIAEAQYPRSLVCLIHSLGGSAQTAKKQGSGVELPLILPTLSCASAQSASQEMFPHFYADYKVQMAALSLNALSEASLVSASDSANIEYVEERVENTGEVNGLPVQVPRVPRINTISTTAASTATQAKELVLLPDTAVKHVDIAGVVVTHALLREVGIGHLLEALHREGLVLRHVYTSHLTAPAAKQLQQLAGASSLSMKPPASLLTHAPALVLGVEGPSHSFVRFKSFSLQARSATQLWKLTGESSQHAPAAASVANIATSSAPTGPGTNAGEWGVLASSSTRLAKDLYKHCFGEIFGDDSAFTFA